jgi:hypothetical protein
VLPDLSREGVDPGRFVAVDGLDMDGLGLELRAAQFDDVEAACLRFGDHGRRFVVQRA